MSPPVRYESRSPESVPHRILLLGIIEHSNRNEQAALIWIKCSEAEAHAAVPPATGFRSVAAPLQPPVFRRVELEIPFPTKN